METMPPEEIKKEMEIKAKKKPSFFWEIIKFSLLAIVIVIPIRLFIAQPFIISGNSMLSTFKNGQYLIVDELSYQLNTPQRGDVVIFKYPRDHSKFFIKRIIALPNETIKKDGLVVTIINKKNPKGFILKEPYLKYTKTDNFNETLGADEYFVMGDNRSASSDSRVWGPLPKKLVVGKAFLRLFPFTQIGVNPGDYKYDESQKKTSLTRIPN